MSKAIDLLDSMIKAAAGEEPGAFRGGDPEEIRIKREEKKEEQEAAGELEDQDEGEEPSPEEIAEAEEEEKQKKEDAGKSLVAKAAAVLAAQVSPVDTFGDYFPRNANGDPLVSQKNDDRYRSPSPVRPGENQHKTWSEVTGIKVPMTDPIQEVRREIRGQDLERMAIHKGGLLGLWHRWNTLSKGVGDAPAKGPHKYVKRWWEGNQWNYEYADAPHGDHGMQHVGKLDEHSLSVHPDFYSLHQNASPEKAYEYAQLRGIAEGGTHKVKLFNKKKNTIEDKIIHFPGTKDAEGNVPHGDDGMPTLPARTSVRVRNPDPNRPEGARAGEKSQTVTAFQKMMSKNQVATEKDAEGNPWLHWHVAGTGPNSSPHVMFDPSSSFSDKNHRAYGKMERGTFKNLKELMDYVASETKDHKDPDKRGRQHKVLESRLRASVPPEERAVAKDWEPTFYTDYKTGEEKEQVYTNKLERGELGTWGEQSVRIEHDHGGHKRTIVRQARVLNLDGDLEERSKILNEVTKENMRQIRAMGVRVLQSRNFWTKGKEPWELESRLHTLIAKSVSRALDKAANMYDPNNEEGARFSTFFLGQLKGEMNNQIPSLMKEEGIDIDLGFRDEWNKRRKWMIRRGASPEEIKAAKKEMSEQYKQQMAHGKEMFGEQAKEAAESYGGASRAEEAADIGMGQRARGRARGEGVTAQSMTGGGQRQARATGPGQTEGVFRGEAAPSPEKAAMEQEQQQQQPEDTLEDTVSLEEAQRLFNDQFPTPEHQQMVTQQMLSMDPKQAQLLPEWLQTMYGHLHRQQETAKSLSALGRAAVAIIKAQDEEDLDALLEPKYKWRDGEPGAYKYMWDDGSGEIVRRTNAPLGHPHFDPQKGYPQDHPEEPIPEQHPHMFDHFGRKLHRAAPEGAEVENNLDYDPDVNSWSQKYQDENGEDHHLALYKDRAQDDRMTFNEDIRHVDAQLEKVRKWSGRMLSSQKPMEQILGLMTALVDQAKMVTGPEGSGIADLKLGNVSKKGNVYKFSLKDEHGGKHVVSAVLDSKASSALHSLANGKQKGDFLFEIDGQRIDQPTFAQTLHEKFGISPKQFRVYHATELFSKEFQKIVSKQKTLEPDHLHSLLDQALVRVARTMGHMTNDPEALKQQLGIDPIAVEALFMAAIHHHSPEISKSIQKGYKLHGQMVFQGLPVSIENRKGSVRKWYDPGAKEHGQTKMHHAYGYIRGTRGVDGDHVDVYIGPDKNADKVFVIHQQKAPEFKQYDEDKCMLGFSSGKEAKDAYIRQYDNPKFFGSMSVMSMEEFKEKVKATKDRPKMIKSLSENSPGPTVWHVSSTAKRTPEEKAFGEWLHSHPMVEHNQQWAAFKNATRIEDPTRAPTGREYAHQAPGLQQSDMDEPEHEDWQEGMGKPEGEAPDIDEPEPAPEETAKSILSQMMEKAV